MGRPLLNEMLKGIITIEKNWAHRSLKGVFAKNERGYRLNAIKKRKISSDHHR